MSSSASPTLGPLIVGIESSCDETGVGIVRGDGRATELLANEVASSVDEHARFGGVVPEVASRNHLAQLPRLLERAVISAKIPLAEIDAFAVEFPTRSELASPGPLVAAKASISLIVIFADATARSSKRGSCAT